LLVSQSPSCRAVRPILPRLVSMTGTVQGVTTRPDNRFVVAPSRDCQRDFDLLVGAWTVQNRRLLRPLSGPREWEEFPATSLVRPLWNGRGHLEEWDAVTAGGVINAVSLHLYDPAARQWRLHLGDRGRRSGRDPSNRIVSRRCGIVLRAGGLRRTVDPPSDHLGRPVRQRVPLGAIVLGGRRRVVGAELDDGLRTYPSRFRLARYARPSHQGVTRSVRLTKR
jgi:hypothetical protein